MANQKLEDQLSLALDTPAQMREKSDNLDTDMHRRKIHGN